jgi:hypothetical protein
MNSEDQDYDQGRDMPQESGNDQQDQNQQNGRYSPKNHSQHTGNQYRNNRRRGGIGNKLKQNVKNRIDPRAKFSREGMRQQIRDFRRDFVKNTGKQVLKKAAMSPWVWLIMGVIALIIFLVLIITGAEEEENCGTGAAGATPTASIEVTGPKKAQKGEKLEYTLTVSGSTAAITIKDPIPEGTKFVSADSGGKNEQNIVTWKLPGDGEVKLTLEATKDSEKIDNIASVDQDGGGEIGVEEGGGKAGDLPDESGDDYKRIQFRGVKVNNRTKKMLEAAEKDFGKPFQLTQGSYNAGGVAASAGTHDGGGVVDISVGGMNPAAITKAVTALRKKNFAAWHRTPAQGFSPHIHAVAIGDKELAPGAAQQVKDYKAGKNGLAGGGKDDGPKVDAETGNDGGGGCEGQGDGAVTKGYVAPSSDDCGGKFKSNSPIGKNFGNPSCSFSKDKLMTLLKEVDSANAAKWFSKIAPCESNYNPNAYNAGAVDAAGAWGLYQMGSAKPPGSPPPAPGKNGVNDRGDVNWELQSTNAAAYQKKAGWGYWACAR